MGTIYELRKTGVKPMDAIHLIGAAGEHQRGVVDIDRHMVCVMR
jgi:hypothetical protein